MAVEKRILDDRLVIQNANDGNLQIIKCEHLSNGGSLSFDETLIAMGDRLYLKLCRRCSASNQINILEKWLK